MSDKEYKIKYGLKIWSTNKKELFKEAVQLFEKKEVDFMELYIVPDSLGNTELLNELKNIPTTIHAPHSEHNFDVFKLNDSKVELFKNQVIKTADLLNSKAIVVHAEAGDSQEIFKKNISLINDKRILIENMTKVGINGELHFGHSYEQLKFIKDCGFNFCFDFSHAIKSAISQGLDYKEFIEKLIVELSPSYFHICGGKTNIEKDEHGDLFDGDFDIKWMKKILLKLTEEKDIHLVFETPKSGDGLENDIKNINYFRSL
ncbi:MAG: hypothetical protein WCT22_05930 [Patescibacteria group bacterium]